MKIGDTAYCKHKFIIEDYNLHDETLTIRLIKGDKSIDKFRVSMYISDLGLYPPAIDFIVPGPHLDHSDPHYYISGSGGTDYGSVSYKGLDYRISLDQDFAYTGKYYLVPKSKGSIQFKFSRLRTEGERILKLKALMNEVYEGNIINGVICYFVRRGLDRRLLHIIDKNLNVGDVAYDETNTGTALYAVLHDLHTNAEYEFRAIYLHTKSTASWL